MISAHTSSLATLSSLVVIFASGCVIGDIDPTNRRCPCVAGYVCDEASDRCVAEMAVDAGDVVPDAGVAEDADVARDADAAHDAEIPLDARPFCDTVDDAIFCEDFESGELSRWNIEPAAGGSITASNLASHAGTYGLRLSAPAGESITRITVPIVTADIEELFFQAWVYVEEDTAGALDVFELFAGDEGSVAAQMLPSSSRFRVRIAAAGTEGPWEGGEARWTVGAWNCVQGRVMRRDMGLVEIGDPAPRRASLAGDTDWGTSFDTFKITVAPSEAGSLIHVDDIVWTLSRRECLSPSP